MKQINYRLSEEEYYLAREMAKLLGKSVPALLKEMGLKEINDARVNLALNLYANDKIGLKRAWKLSCRPFIEFLHLLKEHDIEPNLSDELEDKMMDNALNLKLKKCSPGYLLESCARSSMVLRKSTSGLVRMS